ncbi:MAG TPA: Obg family GTPase CgtA, partial [Beutenbergiaceae bacterium]|nr:Obg family GTPase CgtA [Beutenbergiaceae bacterium]
EPGRDPISDLETIENELAQHSPDLVISGGGRPLQERPRMIVLNKVDVPEARELAEFVLPDLEAKGWPIHVISTATGEGVRELTFAMGALVEQSREEHIDQDLPVVLTPEPVDRGKEEPEFTISKKTGPSGTYFHVMGEKPERWIKQTMFDNDEAVGYLADRLAALGVEEGLYEAGAHPGDEIVIGDVVFDWDPTVLESAGRGPRGSDSRLDQSQRPTRQERREEFKQRMDAKAAAREELRMERE